MKRRAQWMLWLSVLLTLTAMSRADLIVLWPGQIFRYNERTGQLISKHNRDFNTETVDHIALAPNSDFYAFGNSMGWGGVFRLDAVTAEFKQEVISNGYSGIAIPCGITFNPAGELLVSSENRGVQRYDSASGALKGTLIPPDQAGERPFMKTGPDGNLYLLKPQGAIDRYNGVTGEFIDTFVTNTNGGGAAFDISLDGNLYSLAANNHIYRFDANTRQSTDLVNPVAAGMRRPYKLIAGPDGDLYIGDSQLVNSDPLDIWRFDGKTGASKGIFVKGEVPLYGDGWITAMIFSGPRLNICHRDAGPCLRWPNTHGNFELQSCAGLDQPWQAVTQTPTEEGCNLALQLPPSSNQLLFRLIKR
jgi:hypothetical protein